MDSKKTRVFNIVIILSFGMYVLSVYAFLKDPTFFKFSCCSTIMFMIGLNIGSHLTARAARKQAEMFSEHALQKTREMADSFNETFQASNELIANQHIAITKLQLENEQLKNIINGN